MVGYGGRIQRVDALHEEMYNLCPSGRNVWDEKRITARGFPEGYKLHEL
jgi:hypothetical protein